MELILENGEVHREPNKAAIGRALRSLNWQKDNSYAILKKSEWTYMQTAQDDNPEHKHPNYVLEYQDGSLDQHYEATDELLTLEQIIDAFDRYARGDESWREMFHWEKMDLREEMS